MTQHIMVEEVIGDVTIVNPGIVSVWRDDQILIWILKPHLKWPDGPGAPRVPITFGPNWPGGHASPIGEPPIEGQPDQRNYTALCGKILPDGASPEIYSYNIVAVPLGTTINDPSEVHWTDPDVENRPLP